MVQHIKGWFRKLDERPVPEKDPVVYSSMGTLLAVFSFLMMLSLVWAFYQEMVELRPWRQHQEEFAGLYRDALADLRPQRAAEVAEVKATSGYRQLEEGLRAAENQIASDLKELENGEGRIRAQLAVISKDFAEARSQLQATIYALETTPEAREGLSQDVEDLKQRPYEFEMPEGPQTLTYLALEELFSDLKARQGELQSRKSGLLSRPGELRSERDTYLKNRLTGLTEIQVDGLISAVESTTVDIRQIHNAEMNLVDRCESCHLGIREPVELTAGAMGGNQLFASHPRPELLAIHDPEIFGCTPCHNGNGIGTVSATRAHGRYKHWLWPLHHPENFEAGCIQCHRLDRQLEEADTLNAARDLFQNRGCQGCHPYEKFDVEPARMREARKRIADLEIEKEATRVEIERLLEQGDRAASNEEAVGLYKIASEKTLRIAEIDADAGTMGARLDELLMERKRLAPNLKEVRNKLRREWIPVWLKSPQAFRPKTKMPQFRLTGKEIEAISAFIWQSGVREGIPSHAPGNAVRGQQLFDSRGCLACHSVGEGEESVGGTFAANLSRVGEKVNYDYLVRWVHNPRERTLPYDPVLQRDVTREDYESRGLPFQFDLNNNKSPLGDHSLQVQNETVMPNLRLSGEASRDIASYLMTLKREGAEYQPTPFVEDSQLFERGRFLVRHYGCAGCHEIATLEEEGKIGTDLTAEGSKPIERLDFALKTHEAKDEGWYNHKGFFEHKLENPAIFDEGKIKNDLEELRMPDFHLTEEEIGQLTSFLLGSVESKIPEQFYYTPKDDRQDIQKGWWVVKKYNCQGCHEFTPGQETELEVLDRYQGDEVEKLPPSLVGQGARTNPEWLKTFLQNPALSHAELNRNGVRPYLDVRMPTFSLSNGEIGVLLRFFAALSKQPLPYLPQQLEPLSGHETRLARELFTSNAAPCLRCHATGDPRTDADKTAPDFALVRERLKADWTQRWVVHPEIIRPGTTMPSGLFRLEGDRWVFALADFPSFRDYAEDHSWLVVRYMFEYTPEEQRRLIGR